MGKQCDYPNFTKEAQKIKWIAQGQQQAHPEIK